MNRYQGSYHYNTIDDRPMLGLIDDDFQETKSNHSVENDDNSYNEEYENEAKQLLDDLDELLPKSPEVPVEKCDLPNDNHHNGPLPLWYKRKLDSKIREAKDRLELLSNMVCNICPLVAVHVKRIEQDHGATFCKMDFPRHPSLNKPWTNSWKFNCAVKCKETNNPTHSHTGNCKSEVVLEHVDTGVSMATSNICANEYPKFVMDTVELFQDFANQNMKKTLDTLHESTLWTGIKVIIRSNYKNKLMIVIRGKKIGPLKYQLRKYFENGPGKYSDVMSVSSIEQAWKKNINKVDAENIYGLYTLEDKIGSVSIQYKPKISADFNSIEVAQLGKIIKDYAGLTKETTLLHIGCSFGVLSLIMSDECESVIGLNTMHSINNELHQAEDIKRMNKINNVSFNGCNPEDLITKCSPFVKGCITVAVLNLATPYGKSKYTMDALRNIPSIWRVIVYGPFTKEYRTNIVKLTNENDASGDHFLPMQGCILDKSPSAENAFDIVILFERPSLIMPKLKLEVLASGPTVNIKLDSEAGKYETLDEEELKPKISVVRNQNLRIFEEKYRKSPPYSSSFSHSLRRSVRSPSPRRSIRSPSSRRCFRSPSPKRSQRSPSSRRSQRSSSPRSHATDRYSDRSAHKYKSHPAPPVHKEKDTAVYPSSSNEFRIKAEPTEDRLPPRNKNQLPTSSSHEKSLDWPILDINDQLKKENDQSLHEERRDKTSLHSYPLLSVRKEFQFFCPTPPRERPPTPPADTSLHIDASRIKEEINADWNIPSWTTIISEPEQLQNKEESIFNINNDGIPINSVTVASTFSTNSLDINCEPIPPLPIIVKSEPIDSYEVPSPMVAAGNNILSPVIFNSEPVDNHDISAQFETGANVNLPETVKSEPVDSDELRDGNSSELMADESIPLHTLKSEPVERPTQLHEPLEDIPLPLPMTTVKPEPVDLFKIPIQLVKSESQDMEISPNVQDIQSMATPIHIPRPVTITSPHSVFANLDGFEFALNATKSYITLSRDPELPNSTFNIKTEPAKKEHLENNEETDEKTSEQPIEKKVNISIKSELEEGECVETDEEIKLIDEKMIESKANINIVKTEPRDDEIKIISEKRIEQQAESKPNICVKTEDEMKVKNEVEETYDDDLRILIEERKKILDILNQDKDTPYQKELPLSYERLSSPSPPSRSSRKYNRSPSSRRPGRSPSPYRHRSPSSKRRRRSPYRSRRSPLPNYRRSRWSPTSPVRVKREPYSPDRSKREPFSSVNNKRGDRSRRSPFILSFKREIYGRTSRKRSRSKSPKRRKSKSPSRS